MSDCTCCYENGHAAYCPEGKILDLTARITAQDALIERLRAELHRSPVRGARSGEVNTSDCDRWRLTTDAPGEVVGEEVSGE